MQEERFRILAALHLSGEATPAEQRELDDLLLQQPEQAVRLETLRRIWQARQEMPVRKEEAYHRHLQRLNAYLSAPNGAEPARSEPPALPDLFNPGRAEPDPSSTMLPETSPIPLRRLRKWTIAATAAAASVAGFLLIARHNSPVGKEALAANTVSTRPGSRSRVQLPDGTQVWLNADSRLTYNGDFNNSSREVQLTGEAYFDVAKDIQHPFLIHTNVIDIKVLGTTFNVRSYGDERLTETALIQGSVEVTVHNNPGKKIILKPNEKLIVHNDQVTIRSGHAIPEPNPDEPFMTVGKVHFQKKDSSITETLWIKNQLAFDNASLEEVARQLERWYGVKVTIREDRLKTIRLNAVFGDESLPQVMEALGIAGNFKYDINNKEVIIGP